MKKIIIAASLLLFTNPAISTGGEYYEYCSNKYSTNIRSEIVYNCLAPMAAAKDKEVKSLLNTLIMESKERYDEIMKSVKKGEWPMQAPDGPKITQLSMDILFQHYHQYELDLCNIEQDGVTQYLSDGFEYECSIHMKQQMIEDINYIRKHKLEN
ncbi:MAG: hypothetical protein Q9N62_00195 [Ghiorsea sp.]|nr:hypothetical protein [Ghiorsea sp.]